MFRLITRSTLVGCSIGGSAGFAPRRILSMYPTSKANVQAKLGPYVIKPPASANSLI